MQITLLDNRAGGGFPYYLLTAHHHPIKSVQNYFYTQIKTWLPRAKNVLLEYAKILH